LRNGLQVVATGKEFLLNSKVVEYIHLCDSDDPIDIANTIKNVKLNICQSTQNGLKLLDNAFLNDLTSLLKENNFDQENNPKVSE
jgi:hypothetical protein